MQDTLTRTCARCGQPVDRVKDSYNVIGDQIVHKSCPTSAAVKSLPAVTHAKPGQQFIRVADAARMLSVSERTIERHIQAGTLPAKRLPSSVSGKGRPTILIDQADVLALLEDYLPSKGEEVSEEASSPEAFTKEE